MSKTSFDYVAIFRACFGFALEIAIVFASPIGFDLAIDFASVMRPQLVKISRRITKKIPLKFRLFSHIFKSDHVVEEIWNVTFYFRFVWSETG